jgi:hypothetical protein
MILVPRYQKNGTSVPKTDTSYAIASGVYLIDHKISYVNRVSMQ